MTDYLAAFRGTITGGATSEIFSHSLPVRSSASASSVANAMVSAFTTRWPGPTGLAVVFGTAVTYTEVTVASIIDPLFHTEPDPENPGDVIHLGPKVSVAYHAPFTPPLVGADAAGTLPAQNAIAISYSALAAMPNGADAKGRFYLPTPAKSMVNDVGGALSTQGQTTCLNFWDSFMGDIQGQGISPCVWSRKYGVLFAAQELRVGDRVDTIRSRRNAQPENYAVASVGP